MTAGGAGGTANGTGGESEAPPPPAARRLRAAGPFDLDLLAALQQACFDPARGESWGERWDRNAFGALLDSPVVFALLAEAAGEPVGFTLARVAAGEAELLLIGVVPAARRAGHGMALLEATAVRARACGAAELFLEVAEDNFAAQRLYRGAGFAEVGRRRNYYHRQDGYTDALIMRRSLAR